jgi:alpha-mannosidase
LCTLYVIHQQYPYLHGCRYVGHKFLKEELNYLPRVGWQIDPFGHSNTHAWLSSAVGFDSLFFGRIDYQDRARRMAEKNMEMVWKGSASDAEQSVFTGTL